MNILVTGGAGYIGSILVPLLLEKRYKVTVIDSFLYNQNSLAHVCYHKNLSIIKSDIRNTNYFQPLLKNFDIIIPLAALVGAPICSFDPVGAKSVNYDSILEILKNISKNQIVIMPTTNSAYGSGDKNNFCTEKTKLKPISQYAIEKVKIEKKLVEHDNYISLRLATVFGASPRMRVDLLVNDFVYRAVNDKYLMLFESHFKRNYIHVKDVGNVFVHSIKNYSKMKNQIYNVGLSNANLSKLELCIKIKKIIKNFVFIDSNIGKDPDQRNYIVSNQKIENTGFKPKYSIEFGIRELIKLYSSIKINLYKNY